MTMTLDLRPERPDDYATIDEVVTAAFRQTDEATLVRRLRAAGDHLPPLCLVATEAGRLRGHVFYSRGWLRRGAARVPILVLAPLAVHPQWQRQGIGQALIRESLARARAAGYGAVSVLGDPAYYPRLGFRPAGHWGIVPPFAVPPQAFMAQELRADALAGVAGSLQYAPAFAGLEA